MEQGYSTPTVRPRLDVVDFKAGQNYDEGQGVESLELWRGQALVPDSCLEVLQVRG